MRDEEPRLAELLGSLSLATDLAAGLLPETALRSAIVAARLGSAAGIQGFELRDVYYTGVLRFIGCTAYAHEMAAASAGDDRRLLRTLTTVDTTKLAKALGGALRGMNPQASIVDKATSFARFAASPHAGAELAASHCDLAVRLAGRLGMSNGVIESLGQMYERWDGKGAPLELRGDAIRNGARVLHVAWRIAAHGLLEGRDAAAALVRDRAGSEFDPRIAGVANEEFPSLVEGFAVPSVWELYLDTEPRPSLRVNRARIADVARAFAQYVDVKSPYTLSHCTGVGELAKEAARVAGLKEEEQSRVEIAALLHDLGRVGIANGIWDKAGKLAPREWDIVREHTYQTERVLARSPLLAPYAKTASLHHERLDGSGYHRNAEAGALDRAARLIAAADVYHALTEERAHRAAHTAKKAADALSEEARAGRLCRNAVEAVLGAAGHRKNRVRGNYPAQLSEREVEVIGLVARGLSNKDVAERLSISHKTVQRHMESIFAKTGVRTRAAAAVFAVDQHLIATD